MPQTVASKRAVVGGRLKTVRAVAPDSTTIVRYHTPAVHIQTTHSGGPALLSQTSRLSLHIDAEFHRCNSLTLALDLTVGGSTTAIPPSWRFFDRIAVRANGGSTSLVDLHPECFPLRLAAKYSFDRAGQLPYVLKEMGATSFAGASQDYAVGTHRFLLPIIGLFDNSMIEGLDTIILDLYPAAVVPNNVIMNTGVHVIVGTDRVVAADRVASLKLHQGAIVSKPVTEMVRIDYTGRTLTPNVESNFDLDAFSHKSAGLLVLIKNISNGSLIDVGDGAIDHESSAGRSVFGMGQIVPLSFLNSMMEPFGNGFLSEHACILLPYTDSVALALNAGVRSGYHTFDGSKERLIIRPATDFPGGSYDVTIYSLSYRALNRFNDRLHVENV